MHLLFLATVILSLSAYAAADWVTINQYKDFDNSCATSSGRATAFVVNTCLPSPYSTESTYYNYSASINSSIVIVQQYNTKDCTGAISNSDRYIFGQCYYGTLVTYSATQPQFTGKITQTFANGCGSNPVSLDVTYFGVCNYGTLYSYYGGGSCFYQQFNKSDCTGTVNYGYTTRGSNCYSYNTIATADYCSVNGVTLPRQSAPPAIASGSSYVAYRSYAQSNCTGTPTISYDFANGCDGQGDYTSYGATSYTTTTYDNANCTGYQVSTNTYTYGSKNVDFNPGQCVTNQYHSGDRSHKSTLEALPTGSFVSIGLITVDKCDNPTQTYSASLYTNGCVQDNSTSSSKISCSVVGANTTYTSSIYNSIDCSGAVVATETFSVYSCAPTTYNPYTSVKYLCNAALPKTSDATTTSRSSYAMYVAVMMIAAVAYVL